jgi:uncharacterized protein YgbK (DUF1537 family)
VGRLVGNVTFPVVTKAGAFGGPDAFVDAVSRLRSEPGPHHTEES